MMKTLFSAMMIFAVSAAFAQCEGCPTEAKVQSACTEAKVQSACSGKVAQSCDDEEFMAIAAKMTQEAEGGKSGEACCKSTEAKVVAKGGKGCCNEMGEKAKFKVMVAGNYKFFGCKDSAAKARKDYMVKGVKVGKIQAVTSTRTKIS